MASKVRVAAAAAAGVLVAIQLVPVARDNPPVEQPLAMPPEIAAVVERSCFDCHSHQTRWPWYSRVAPASWLVAYDVDEGRGHLNFSAWNRVAPEKVAHAFEEIAEEVGEGVMPLRQYTLLHPQAKLSDAERAALVRWAQAQEQSAR